MKIPRWTILGFLLLGAALWAVPFQMTYSGLFPANREGKGVQTYLLLVDQPRQVNFTLTDEKGNPQPNVRVIEVSSSGTSSGTKNPQGLTLADLPESGIYELRVSADPAAVGEVGFVLKVIDTGVPPAVSAQTTVAQPVENSTVENPPPVLPMAPLTPEVVEKPAPPSGQILVKEPPPSPKPFPEAPSPQPAAATVPTAAPQPPIPALPKPSMPASPPASAAASSAAVATVPPAIPSPASILYLISRYPQGLGYADPYRPVEVQFDRALDAGTSPETVLQVGLLAPDGQWKPVPGQWFAAGKNGVRFLAKRMQPGAVYHVRVTNPWTKARIEDFTFATFPEVRLGLAKTAEGLQGDLDWNAASDVLPGPEGQVVRLDNSELVVRSGEKELIRFPFSTDMAPFGTRDNLRFQGRPFGFSLAIPASRIAEGGATLSMSLFTTITGRDGSLEVARTTLVSGSVASTSLGTSAAVPVGGTPATTASAALSETAGVPPALPAAASAPVKTAAQPTPAANSAPVQNPVVAIADPGSGATVLPESDFSAAEDSASAHKCWPRGATWGPDGALWVIDSQNRRILEFNDQGKRMRAFGAQGKGTGGLRLPIDLGFGPAEILVSDSAAHAVHVFSMNGDPIRTIGTWGTRPGQVDLPHGVDFADGQIWLAERGNCQVMRFSLDGVFLSAFGRKDAAPGGFEAPIGIRLHGNSVWVMEPKKGRVQQFNRDGKYQGGFIAGTVDAAGLDVDPWGCVWIADAEGHRVLRYNPAGKLLINIESPLGPKPWIPTSVCVRKDGMIAVSDAANRMIRLFRLKKP